jgi:hypothetical protein
MAVICFDPDGAGAAGAGAAAAAMTAFFLTRIFFFTNGVAAISG